MNAAVEDSPDLDPDIAWGRWQAAQEARAAAEAAEAAAEALWRSRAYFLTDIAAVIGVSTDAVDSFRATSVAEGGGGPQGLPSPDGYIDDVGKYPRPWWNPETIIWWAVVTGRLHPYTGEPQRLPQANQPLPRRPFVPAPDPDVIRRLLVDDTLLYLADIAALAGYSADTVKKEFRLASLRQGGMGPHALPDPDGYDPPVKKGAKPWRPRWKAGTVRWWLIATGRMSPYTGEPIRR